MAQWLRILNSFWEGCLVLSLGYLASDSWTSRQCQWPGSQVGPVIGWPLPQVLHPLYPTTSCRQDKLSQRLCSWVGDPIPLEVLPDYRRALIIAEDLDSIPCTHMAAPWITAVLGDPGTSSVTSIGTNTHIVVHRHICTKYPHTLNKPFK